jgi:hypothetical protein
MKMNVCDEQTAADVEVLNAKFCVQNICVICSKCQTLDKTVVEVKN